jgi:hypothetical protein
MKRMGITFFALHITQGMYIDKISYSSQRDTNEGCDLKHNVVAIRSKGCKHDMFRVDGVSLLLISFHLSIYSHQLATANPHTQPQPQTHLSIGL